MVVTKDTLIGEILQENAEAAAPYFFAIGMHCLGCPASVGETIEEACLCMTPTRTSLWKT